MRLRPWLGFAPIPRIAPLDMKHAATLARIHAETFTRPWAEIEFEDYLSQKAIHGDGVFLGGRAAPVGFVVARQTVDEAEILSVALSRECRGRGFGGLLLDRHLKRLEEAGIRRVFLEVEEDNLAALALYRRRGFTENGRRVGYYVKPDGRRATAIAMIARL